MNIQLESLPSSVRTVIRVSQLNAIQTKCFHNIFETDENVVVSAPTGSGKTLLFELAILRLFLQKGHNLERQWKAVYIGIECTSDFNNDDGDSSLYNHLEEANLIVTTPEKWDSITRNWSQYFPIINAVNLVLLDEVHLLNVPKCGATLEAVVARTRTLAGVQRNAIRSPRQQNVVRFVATSATIPNVVDIAEWLGVWKPACVHEFDSSYRPIPLEVLEKLFSMNFNTYYVFKVPCYGLPKIGQNKWFCFRKKIKQELAPNYQSVFYWKSHFSVLALLGACQIIGDSTLQSFIRRGVAYHHSSLNLSTRKMIEDLFLNEHIKVLCTTSTLAHGVNLPAYLVVIKSTLSYKDGTYKEYDELEVLQMSRRAGRPQFDTKGVVVIMTQSQSQSKWQKITAGQHRIESQLASSIPEHLNAEISLRTIPNIETAMVWLKSTFFYIRVKKDPTKIPSSYSIDLYLQNTYINQSLQRLKDIELISVQTINDKILLSPLPLGFAMAKHGVALETMTTITSLDESVIKNVSSDILNRQLLECIASADEFKEFSPRMCERKMLRKLATHQALKWKCKGAISTPAKKAFVLLQCALSRIKIDHWQLQADQTIALCLAERIAMCVQEFLLQRGFGPAYVITLKLIKSLKLKLWDVSEMECLQLSGVEDVTAQKLADHKITRLDDIAKANSAIYEATFGRSGLTAALKWQIEAARIPRCICICNNISKKSTNEQPLAEVRLMSANFNEQNQNGQQHLMIHNYVNQCTIKNKTPYVLVIYNDCNTIVFIKKIYAPLISELNLTIPYNGSQYVTGELICQSWIGLDTIFQFTNPNFPASLIKTTNETLQATKSSATKIKKTNNKESVNPSSTKPSRHVTTAMVNTSIPRTGLIPPPNHSNLLSIPSGNVSSRTQWQKPIHAADGDIQNTTKPWNSETEHTKKQLVALLNNPFSSTASYSALDESISSYRREIQTQEAPGILRLQSHFKLREDLPIAPLNHLSKEISNVIEETENRMLKQEGFTVVPITRKRERPSKAIVEVLPKLHINNLKHPQKQIFAIQKDVTTNDTTATKKDIGLIETFIESLGFDL